MSARDDVLALRSRMVESIVGQEKMIERLLLARQKPSTEPRQRG